MVFYLFFSYKSGVSSQVHWLISIIIIKIETSLMFNQHIISILCTEWTYVAKYVRYTRIFYLQMPQHAHIETFNTECKDDVAWAWPKSSNSCVKDFHTTCIGSLLK